MLRQLVFVIAGGALMTMSGIGNAAQTESKFDILRALAVDVGGVLGSASACTNILPARIKDIADKFSSLINTHITRNEEASSIRQVYDENIVVGQRMVSGGLTDCAAVHNKLSELERSVTSSVTAAVTSPMRAADDTSPTPAPNAGATGASPTRAALANGLPRRSIDALRFAGSNTIGAELVPELLRLYARTAGAGDILEDKPGEEEFSLRATGKSAEFSASVASHGSATAVTALLKADADIGMMSRPITSDEVGSLAQIGFGEANGPGQEHVIALDGILVFVNKGNAVTELSLSDIAAIFSGAVADWSQLGGQPGRINVYARDNKSGTWDTFKTLVLKDRKLVASAARYESSEQLSDAVANDPNGIGFAGFAYLRDAKAVSIKTDCGLSFAPSAFAVKTEEYPLSRRLFLYVSNHEENREVGQFVEFALSAAAQRAVDGKGFVSLLPELSSKDYVTERLALPARDRGDPKLFASFRQGAGNGVRLSITFRFRIGRSELDSRAIRDINRLADFVESGKTHGRRIALLGFSDSRGTPARNSALSQVRAEVVAKALRQRNVNPAVVAGYGAAAPVACNSNDEGLDKNRRVEVWVF
ncbi:MAG: phosphate ABC transporter substrate-binding/OmpA family protein [Bradyrhizobium sp.]|uniref:phosphate ABC transporter substrate-binding/OmpA family protein n=1 Tax=Bradyrhizobium sp. TaxID=376 RepID=UPI001D90532C|nr:phosphate ABC transporter substrate-binding/OmpA family protein [Bradyrhizobium sp.]MBV9562468.1 phosphate ABC transporter substrate-binding/OmpA family protein [Bradyrhizobium sp.]